MCAATKTKWSKKTAHNTKDNKGQTIEHSMGEITSTRHKVTVGERQRREDSLQQTTPHPPASDIQCPDYPMTSSDCSTLDQQRRRCRGSCRYLVHSSTAGVEHLAHDHSFDRDRCYSAKTRDCGLCRCDRSRGLRLENRRYENTQDSIAPA